MLSFKLFLFLAWATILDYVSAMPTISTVGSKFFTSDGNQFFIKGVAYQLIDDDPLVNTQQCQLDAALMKQLGANTIRVYHVDPQGDHSGCMNAFAAAGIYLFVDLDSFHTYIRYGSVANWTTYAQSEYRAVMDNFQQYENTAGFFVGNEVLNVVADAEAAPYLLAAAADMKGYAAAKGYRQIPIGYSATDTTVLRPMLQDYVVCRPNATERLDFFSLNSYEWCSAQDTFQTSGYSTLQNIFENYPVPVFFSEDGCNTVPPRTFNDQNTIFGSQMIGTWSGAIIYEWIQEMNAYGLISYGPPQPASVNLGSTVIQGFTRTGTPTPVLPDFTNLQSVWATISPSGVKSASYAAAIQTTPPPCPTSSAGGWTIDPSAPLPTVSNVAVAPGMPSGIPTGSVTVMLTSTDATMNATTSATSTGSLASAQGTSSSRSGSAATSSATAKSGAGQVVTSPLLGNELGFSSLLFALGTVAAGMAFWL